MSVLVNGDSTWTTTNVSTQNMGNGVVYITGISADGVNSVSLDIINYTAHNASYGIQNTGTGINANSSSANYQYGIFGGTAVSGSISISGYSGKTIQGSFDFADTKNHLTGTFTAVTP